jgi:hypothetical protein
MNKRDELYLLYKFASGQEEKFGSLESSYKIIYLFNLNGFLEKSELARVKVDVSEEGSDLEFSSKEQLASFAESIMEENNYSTVYLLASSDYNIGIESCHDLPMLREIFSKYGTAIESSRGPSGSILSKFF